MTGGLTLPAFYLFAIIFFWTPPHFWALALLIRRDYAEAGVPMLPVVAGEESTRRHILLYTLALTMLSLLLYLATDSLGPVYLVSATALGAGVRRVRGAAVQADGAAGGGADLPVLRWRTWRCCSWRSWGTGRGRGAALTRGYRVGTIALLPKVPP